jgi:SAM-dependent methyltransferase
MASGRLDRDWEDYYRAVQSRAPRALFLDMLALFEAEGVDPADAQAVDLGCGDGVETALLLEKGWRVLAADQQPEAISRVRQRVPPEHAERLQTLVAPYHETVLPSAFLVFAGYSLPFCPPEHFQVVWARIMQAITPGGYFVGHLFGERDGWAGAPRMCFHTRAEAEALFVRFELKTFREIDEVRPSALEGPKRWHVYEVIARKSDAAAEP